MQQPLCSSVSPSIKPPPVGHNVRTAQPPSPRPATCCTRSSREGFIHASNVNALSGTNGPTRWLEWNGAESSCAILAYASTPLNRRDEGPDCVGGGDGGIGGDGGATRPVSTLTYEALSQRTLWSSEVCTSPLMSPILSTTTYSCAVSNLYHAMTLS